MTKRKDAKLTEEEKTEIRMKLHTTPPLCFSLRQWKEWRIYAVQVNPADTYCEDCTPEYKERMMKENRCLWPCVEFKVDTDGMLIGTRDSLKKLSAPQLSWLNK